MKKVKIDDREYMIKPITPWNIHLLQKAIQERSEESYREFFKAFVDPQPSDEDSLALFFQISNYVDEIVSKAKFFRKEQSSSDDSRSEYSIEQKAK